MCRFSNAHLEKFCLLFSNESTFTVHGLSVSKTRKRLMRFFLDTLTSESMFDLVVNVFDLCSGVGLYFLSAGVCDEEFFLFVGRSR